MQDDAGKKCICAVDDDPEEDATLASSLHAPDCPMFRKDVLSPPMTDAGKTPEKPRWEARQYAPYSWDVSCGHERLASGLSKFTATAIATKLDHLEGALREKTEQRQLWVDMAKELDDKLTAANKALREAETKAALADEILDGEGPRDYAAAEKWEKTSVYCPWCGEFIEGHMPMPDFKHMEGCVYARWDALQQPTAAAL